ncbi:class I SAM-dependent RNA methyltransferase [Yinghuangia sp. ASG 101]|uniref:class I SAM-dependent RNA methyltransferase n=1 Tax=Yinghuangia sp. ASG 101 TaxID=2896848 RepID=UPI001E5B8DD3|nr:class I SAM-dependent RNA methyltransferase [Yinghuangia sp. ASG 101]UGQ13843.1 class I SAM-dependent RNA methyltransferase [Yinghuangia sp. ASG 101]
MPTFRSAGSPPSAADDAAESLVGARYEVEIGPVAHGGHCVARHEGRVLFVRHGLPGERAVVEVTEGVETSRFLRADVVDVLTASPDRVTPPCPYAGPGRCGGCDWQHAVPAAQRALKGAVVAEQLRRLAGLERDVEVEAVDGPPGMPEGLGWRTRVQFAVDAESGAAGLRKHRSHDVQPIDACAIAAPGVEELGIERRDWRGVASIEAIAASGSLDRAVVVTPAADDGRVPIVELDRPVAVFRADERGRTKRVHGRAGVREVAAGQTWRVSGGGFWQVHPAAADTLVAAVLDGLEPRPGDVALDLYCGVGLFAGAIAARLADSDTVIGVESSRDAVEDARHNLRDVPGARFEAGRVERVLNRPGFLRRADIVVLDPPRAGAGKAVVERIARLTPRRIAYVACDPAALARDLAYFAQHGYRLRTLRAFDLFPQTHHMECVAVLELAPKQPGPTRSK